MFQTIVADPPWSFNDRLPGPGRGAEKHYKVMALEDILSFELPALHTDCRLFLWVVSALPQEGLDVIRAWGFTPKSEIIWVKTTKLGKRWFGMGRQVRMEHERCLIAIKGRPPVLSKSIRSVFTAMAGQHSAKPQEFYDIVEKLSPGPIVELFARSFREGWTCLGDELGTE